MDTQSKLELERLYGLAKSATATTHFYNQVYKYIGYINQSPFLIQILDEDDKEMHIHDVEKQKTVPQQQEGESWHTHFLKKMRHMNSGEHYFISHLFFLLNHNIFDILDWYYTDNLPTEEATIMLNGRKKVSIFDKLQKYFNRNDIIRHSSVDFNEKYITDFPLWKNILINFHISLLKKIDEIQSQTKEETVIVEESVIKKVVADIPVTQEQVVEELVGKIIIELSISGYFKYLDREGVITPTLKEYKLLHMLIESGKNPVHYSDIAKDIFHKQDGTSVRIDIQQLVKKLKTRLGIRPSDRYKLIESSQNYGYYLDLKGDERAIIMP